VGGRDAGSDQFTFSSISAIVAGSPAGRIV
jgi:hypothetical protein